MTVSDLKKYKDSLYTSLCRDISEFEKNFLFIAGGILAFSITFIKDIIKFDSAIWIVLLFISWLLIIISIATMMYSFLKSANASDDLWKIVDDFIVSNDMYDDTIPLTDDQAKQVKGNINTAFFPHKKALRNQRWWAVGFFIGGILLFSVFISINLIQENKTRKETVGNKNTHVIVNDVEVVSNDSLLKIKTK